MVTDLLIIIMRVAPEEPRCRKIWGHQGVESSSSNTPVKLLELGEALINNLNNHHRQHLRLPFINHTLQKTFWADKFPSKRFISITLQNSRWLLTNKTACYLIFNQWRRQPTPTHNNIFCLNNSILRDNQPTPDKCSNLHIVLQALWFLLTSRSLSCRHTVVCKPETPLTGKINKYKWQTRSS